MINLTALVLLWILNIFGLIGWAALTLLLMEVTVCKDARSVNTSRLLNTSVTARIRLFRRSFRSLFYRASFILFVSAFLAVLGSINNLWMGHLPKPVWVFFSVLLTPGLLMLYYHLGYGLTWFRKFGLFIKNQHC